MSEDLTFNRYEPIALSNEHRRLSSARGSGRPHTSLGGWAGKSLYQKQIAAAGLRVTYQSPREADLISRFAPPTGKLNNARIFRRRSGSVSVPVPQCQ